ncbi:MAG: UDP-N-acetylmuramate dehydrogenase [Bacteroidetes bacterium]|nr:UDP-N-acetylmuramate dehydrogenase [Bacteroidota bacterium]MCA6442400.1 UDP-N-acetylmuramate dehydrogenase [Bacteroidota bacterium]
MLIHNNFNLKALNTFGIESYAKYYIELNEEVEFKTLLTNSVFVNSEKLILGGGSNILFTKNFNGFVLHNKIKGINITEDSENYQIVKVGAGENWHEFVLWTIEHRLGGLENLSLIPGYVGASPMQNIGAYGVEIKDTFHQLEALDLNTGDKKVFSNNDCNFGYRESIFKNKVKNKYLITNVFFKLKKTPILNTSYGAINEELTKLNILKPTIKDVSNAVIKIRQSKLPNPKELGNAGSFFKNPEIDAEKHENLKKVFPKLVSYALPENKYKLAAGWLIEECGLKGFEINNAAVHVKQALVLVNKGNCSGKDVLELSNYVIQKVFNKFGVNLEREVNII